MKVFIHGVPVGHEMCGWDTADEKDYLKQFYDFKIESSSAMIVDIIDGVSYYTYVRKNNFSNYEGRSGSYFGLTVSFGRKTCDNVYMLYNIIESIYKQVVVGNLVNEVNSGSSFMVQQIETATINSKNALSFITAILKKYIEEHIGNSFSTIETNIRTKGKTRYSLSEVDSPVFRDAVHSKQVIISSEFPTSAKWASELEQKITPLEDERNRLTKENDNIKEERRQLQSEVDRLTKELTKSEGSVKKKIQEQIQQLQSELSAVTAERDSLKSTLEKARKNIELIDEPSKELMRLLASRFRKEDRQHHQTRIESDSEDRQENSLISWAPVLNSILLLCVLALCALLLCRSCGGEETGTMTAGHSREVSSTNNRDDGVQTEARHNENTDDASYTDENDESSYANDEYDDFRNCSIDIIGYDGTHFSENKEYKLRIVNKEKKEANVPNGTWEVTDGIELLDDDGKFKIDVAKIKRSPIRNMGSFYIQFYYVVNKEKVITRTVRYNNQ